MRLVAERSGIRQFRPPVGGLRRRKFQRGIDKGRLPVTELHGCERVFWLSGVCPRRESTKLPPELYHLLHGVDKSRRVEGFDDVAVSVPLVAFAYVQGRGRAGKHDCGNDLQAIFLLQYLDEFLTIHAGHIDVDQDQLRDYRVLEFALFAHVLQRFQAAMDDGKPAKRFRSLEGALDDLDIALIVLHQSNISRGAFMNHHEGSGAV